MAVFLKIPALELWRSIGKTGSVLIGRQPATVWASKKKHLEVVRRLYAMRFPGGLADDLAMEQIRGHEGVRVREAYARVSRETGMPWAAHNYKQGD